MIPESLRELQYLILRCLRPGHEAARLGMRSFTSVLLVTLTVLRRLHLETRVVMASQ